MGIEEDTKRLIWQARRGALELDILFSGYIKNCYEKSSAELQDNFKELLKEDDPKLLKWLVYGEAAPKNYQDIVATILKCKNK